MKASIEIKWRNHHEEVNSAAARKEEKPEKAINSRKRLKEKELLRTCACKRGMRHDITRGSVFSERISMAASRAHVSLRRGAKRA